VFNLVLLWRNALGQRNYTDGSPGFDTTCACYPTDADEPVVDSASPNQYTPRQTIGFVITYALNR
jgi:hypothetical protein